MSHHEITMFKFRICTSFVITPKMVSGFQKLFLFSEMFFLHIFLCAFTDHHGNVN